MRPADRELFLGIEGGGTRTVALLAEKQTSSPQGFVQLARAEFGPGNVRLLDDSDLDELFREVSQTFEVPHAIGFGLAGVRDPADRARVKNLAAITWPGTPVTITHDLEIALEAGETAPNSDAKILVLSGTGSCIYGKRFSPSASEAKVGGWGHLLGDLGSGYDIALQALKDVAFQYDRTRSLGTLGRTLLRHLLLNNPEDLIAWVQTAPKADIAAVAPAVFESAASDASARRILESAAQRLATDAAICAERLRAKKPAFLFAGSVLLKQPKFRSRIAALIREQWPGAACQTLEREAVWGAVKLAARAETALVQVANVPQRAIAVPQFDPTASPTEQRNPRTTDLSRLSPNAIVRLMLDEERAVVPAVVAVQNQIARGASLAAAALRNNGRIFYVGAGTSGRLGVLDASECPPTFRASPESVQGIIAGGQKALWQAVEGAEDDFAAGIQSIASRAISKRDLVIGIAASGRTPFVWGALKEARQRSARTALICFNPSLKISREQKPDVLIAANVGPEVLTGSTRLKAGTATKLILNMISTIAMVRAGKVMSNLMIDLNPSNVKLRDRAIRIVQELTGATQEESRLALEKRAWVVRDAVTQLARGAGRKRKSSV